MRKENFMESEAMTFILRLFLVVSFAQLIFIGSGFFFSKYYFDLVRAMQILSHTIFVLSMVVNILAHFIMPKFSQNKHLVEITLGMSAIAEIAMALSQLN